MKDALLDDVYRQKDKAQVAALIKQALTVAYQSKPTIAPNILRIKITHPQF